MQCKHNITPNAIKNLKGMLKTIPFKNNFRIHKCYNVKVSPSWYIEKDRRIKDLHIVFVKGGSGNYFLDGRKEKLQRGKIIFVSTNYTYSAVQDFDNPPRIIPVRFGTYSNDELKSVCLVKNPFCFTFIPNDVQKYEYLFEMLYKYYYNRNCLSNYYSLTSALLEIIMNECLFVLNSLEKNTYYVDRRLEKARLYIEENPDTHISLKDLAKISELSEKYFSKLFKEQYGINPQTYQVKTRMNYARFLLEETNQNVKQVAFSLGYSDQYAFSTQFKKIIGISPSQIKNIKK